MTNTLILHRMPDELTGGQLIATYILSLNGVEIRRAWIAYQHGPSPDMAWPTELHTIASAMELALQTRCNVRDNRPVTRHAARVNVPGVRLVSPQQ